MNLYQPTITGSLAVSGSVIVNGTVTATSFSGLLTGTASLATTASYAIVATSASHAASASNALAAQSASYVLNAVSSSYILNAQSASIATTALTASFVENAQTASYVLNAVSSSFALTASSADNLLVRNTLTAQTLVVQTITSSVDFVTGSTRFGSIAANTHVFTGSVSITGSLAVVTTGTEFQVTNTGVNFGNVIGDAHSITGSVGISGSLSGTSATFSGNVGIGSNSPASKLSVGGDGYAGRAITAIANNADFAMTLRQDSATGSGLQIFVNQNLWGSGTTPFLIANLTGNLFSISSTGAATFSSSITATSATFSDIVRNTTGGIWTASPLGFLLRNDANNANLGGLSRRSYWAGAAALDTQIFAETGYGIFLNVNGSTTSGMTITSGGNVGIGLIDPANKLQVNVSSNATTLYNDNSYPLQIKNTSTTNNSYVGMYFGTGLGVGVTIQALYTNASTSSEGNLLFSTRNSGGSLDERMRITSGGVVAINNQNANTAYALGIKITGTTVRNGIDIVNDYQGASGAGENISCYNNINGIVTMQVLGNGNLVNYNGSYGTIASDRRLKENIVNATPKLNDILKLNVVNFNLIGNEEKHIGFIAQEMQEVFPSFVYQNDTRKYDEDGNIISGLEDALGVKVGMEFAILVKAIQELKTEFDAYKTTHP